MPPTTLELTDIQGLVARGYGNFPHARFFLLAFASGLSGRAWLRDIRPIITPGDPKPDRAATHVAFTAPGLAALGVTGETLHGFSREFHEGMTAPHRRRTLGDTGDGDPAGWHWGGPSTAEVHALVMVYAVDAATLAELSTAQEAAAAANGVTLIASFDTSTALDREPFGFRDGVSQPFIPGLGKTGPAVQTIRPGEFVLGYENEYGLLTDSPTVPESPASASLPSAGDGSRDLGHNGTYLVFRQLAQDVPGFWNYMRSLAEEHPAASGYTAEHLAAKMVGRWPSGAPLVESPHHDAPDIADHNDFGYYHTDRHGMACPVGAHVRRANPRDSLDPDPGSPASYELNKRHRLLRRGRPYGSRLTPEQVFAGESGEGERGLHFIALSANIARQFEFIQQTWISNPKFGDGYDEVDPLIGTRDASGATFVMPDTPVRRRIKGIPSFVTVRGGAYFFLPGLRALDYLAAER